MSHRLSIGAVMGLIGGIAFGLLISHLLTQPEPDCPRGQHFTYPIEQCIGPMLFKGVHAP